MAVYGVAQVRIDDPVEYQKYIDGFLEIFGRFGGEVLAVDDHADVLEGEWPYTRIVIVRFESKDAFRAWYDSPDYQGLAEHRLAASEGSIVLIDGLG
jgi:uncharacterized protein (DUF1330 family)